MNIFSQNNLKSVTFIDLYDKNKKYHSLKIRHLEYFGHTLKFQYFDVRMCRFTIG
jgi:hypothetical protein